MKTKITMIVGLALTAILAHSDVHGTYRWDQRGSIEGRNYTVRREIKIEKNGSATLTTSLRGAAPNNVNAAKVVFGNLIVDVIASGPGAHTGQWSEDRNRLRVQLTSFRAGNRQSTVNTTLVFEKRGREMTATTQDRGIYGRESLTFDVGNNWFEDAATDRDWEGTYSVELFSPDPNEQYTIVRTLKLNRGGDAELRSEYTRKRPVESNRAREYYGSLLGNIAERRAVTHQGAWSIERNRAKVVFDRLEPNRMSVRSEFEFERTGAELRATRSDRRNYGTAEMRLGKSRRVQIYASGGWNGSGGGSQPTILGRYYETFKSPSGREVVRLIELRDNAEALVQTYPSKGTFTATVADVQALGTVLLYFDRFKSVDHEGTWNRSGNTITINLERIGNNRVRSTLVLRETGNVLSLVVQSEQEYGKQKGTYIKK